VQGDPIGLKGGVNLFGYVGANPIGEFDSLGLDYGTTSCFYYEQRCKKTGGGYYCKTAKKCAI
jgi:uncharacterized protein RhaS with RHS repeats